MKKKFYELVKMAVGGFLLAAAGGSFQGIPVFGAPAQALRQEPAAESTGLEELKAGLGGGSQTGLEELRIGQTQAWIGKQGVAIGSVVPIHDAAGEVVGRAVLPNPERVRLVSAWNPAIEKEDFPKWQEPGTPVDEAELKRLKETGLSFTDWRQTMDKPPTDLQGASLVYLSNSLQSNFRHPWGFLIVNDQLIRQRYTEGEYPLDAASLEGKGYDDALWTFVLEPGPPRLTALRFRGNLPIDELLDVQIEKGRPVASQRKDPKITHAIGGIPFLLHGKDVTGQIRSFLLPDGSHRELRPNEVTWPLERSAAFSALGTRQDNQIVLLSVTAHVTAPQIAQLLQGLGVANAILLGGSADVQQSLLERGTSERDYLFDLVATADEGSTDKGQRDRPLNAVLAGYELRATELEELHAADLISGWGKLGEPDQWRLAGQLSDAVDLPTLRSLVEYVQHPVNPPDTLYQVVGDILGFSPQEVRNLVESLGLDAYQPPVTLPIGESKQLVAMNPQEVRSLMEGTVFVIAAGGGGDRFKRSLPRSTRDQLERHGRLEKPTVMIGPSGTSPVVHTLEELSELAEQVGAKDIPVMVVTGIDSRSAVERDLRENRRWIDQVGRLKILEVQQPSYPSFDPATGKILTTENPRIGRPDLLLNPNGTLGVFRAAYGETQRQGWSQGRSWLILYGDDPILNTADFIRRVLTQARYLDVAPVAIPKLNRLTPPGGTLVDLVLPGGRRIHLIVEKAEREMDPEKGIPGLPVFNRREDEAAEGGKDPFLFNTGPLKLSEQAAAGAAAFTPRLRHADRSGVRKLELFATHIATMIGNREGMQYGVLQVDADQYGAAKSYGEVALAVQRIDRRSRERLRLFPGHQQVQFGEQVTLEIRPGFRGFRGQPRLRLDIPAGIVLDFRGLTMVPIIGDFEKVTLKESDPSDPTRTMERVIHHPIFADPGEGKLIYPAGADGLVEVPGFGDATGLEETETAILKQAGPFIPSGAGSRRLEFFVDTRSGFENDIKILEFAVWLAVQLVQRGFTEDWPIGFSGVAQEEEFQEALGWIHQRKGLTSQEIDFVRTVMENRISTYSLGGYDEAKREALARLSGRYVVVDRITEEKILEIATALEKAGLSSLSAGLEEQFRENIFREAA